MKTIRWSSHCSQAGPLTALRQKWVYIVGGSLFYVLCVLCIVFFIPWAAVPKIQLSCLILSLREEADIETADGREMKKMCTESLLSPIFERINIFVLR